MKKIGRNDPCPCGSGKKYKQCCSQLEAGQPVSGITDGEISNALQAAIGHHQAGRLPQAEALYQQILQLQPNHPDALHLLGLIAYQLGKHGAAVELIRKALTFVPNFADAHNNLGNALQAQGQMDEAVVCFRRALLIRPDYAEAYYNLGNALKDQDQLDEATACYRQALLIKPDYAVAYSNLGNTLKDQDQLDEAIACYRQALLIKPDFVEAYLNLGAALQNQGQLDEAVACHRQALLIKSDFAEAYLNLGNVLKDQGRLDEAEVCYRRALALKPAALEYACNVGLLLPKIPSSANTITDWRKRYQVGIETLAMFTGTLDDSAQPILSTGSFDLAYHNADDRSLMESLCRMFRAKVPTLTFTAPHVPVLQPPTDGRRIRIGFLSQFFFDHTIGKLYQGFIRHLDRACFEVVLIHTPKAKRDAFSAQLDALADKVIQLSGNLATQQQTIATEQLDVLFYPDIGMSPVPYLLAYARLAQVQVVSWGHPDTTGVDMLDYFVSSGAIEPPEADAQYSERLVRLNRLPCFYPPLIAPTTIPARTALGLPETGTLYGCPQSPFKLHPEFDAVLAQIAEGDPNGHIVLLEGNATTWSGLLRARWADTFPILLDRVVFLPRQPLDRFMALMAHFDVLLDPIHFGSGNTLYEAMAYGTPIVTWPGRFMRGRIVAGAYRQMGIADAPIAARLEDYAPLALALGRDPERRQALRQASLQGARELFADMQAVREFETFLEAAVAAARRGEKLPAGWQSAARTGTTA